MIRFALLILLFTACSGSGGEKNLADTVREINAKCPLQLDGDTRIDSVSSQGDHILNYHYTLLRLDARLADTVQLRNALWPGILSTIRLNPSMSRLRDKRTTVSYIYNDVYGRRACTLVVKPADYGM